MGMLNDECRMLNGEWGKAVILSARLCEKPIGFATVFFGVLSSPKDELSFTSRRLTGCGGLQAAVEIS